jgi:hypothetical protein
MPVLGSSPFASEIQTGRSYERYWMSLNRDQGGDC